jgi:hypothetical protein
MARIFSGKVDGDAVSDLQTARQNEPLLAFS